MHRTKISMIHIFKHQFNILLLNNDFISMNRRQICRFEQQHHSYFRDFLYRIQRRRLHSKFLSMIFH